MPENPTSATKKHQTGGGCAIGHAGPRSSSVMLLAALLIVLATRRRRA
jgi:MYXO-CTERM domain-containing protein